MKLNKNYLRHTMIGQTVLVPTGNAKFHGLVQGNKTLGALLECLSTDTTQEAIVEQLCKRFQGDRAVISADVAEAIEQLKAIGAIDE